MLESKVELKAAVESMKGDILKEFATILKAQAVEHSKALAQVQVTKTETRSAGAHRAAGVYSGQGTGYNVVTNRSTSRAGTCLTSLSWREAVLP